jgi:rhodanese-related sulfurtransferase
MAGRMTIEDVAGLDLTYAPPYSEAMDILITGANALCNKMDGLLKGVGAIELQADLEVGRAPFVLDVRSQAEFVSGHVSGATSIPLGALRSRAAEVPRDSRVVLYCQSSLRAWEATRALAGLGYDKLELLEGGVTAWPFELEIGAGAGSKA